MPLLTRGPVLVVGTLAVGIALLVQTAASAEDPPPPAVAFDATLTEVTEPPSDPLALLTTPALSDTLQENFQQSVQDCTERAGFTYTVPEAPAEPEASPFSPDAQAGYGVVLSHTPEALEVEVAAQEEAREANLDYAQSLPAEDADLYLEVIGEAAPTQPAAPGEATSCMDAAAATVLAPAMEAQAALAEETFRVADAIEARADVQQADQEWSACMAAAGHDYGSPAEPEQEIVGALAQATSPDLDSLLAQETTVAAADAECRESTGYTQTIEQAAIEEWQAADVDIDIVNTAAGAVQ